MKQLTCEMCGGTELLKEDGLYVCQACGTKYSVEEAKKLMVEVEGKVDVSGSSVKVYNVAEIADAINEHDNKDAKSKVRLGFILSAISELILLITSQILFLKGNTDRAARVGGSVISEKFAIIAIIMFALVFLVTLFFIAKPKKLTFILFSLFVVLYISYIVLSIFTNNTHLLIFVIYLLWLPMISKNYRRIK